MADAEKLRECVERNSSREKSDDRAQVPKREAPQRPRSAVEYYTRWIVLDVLGFVLVILFLSFLAFMYLNYGLRWGEQEAANAVVSVGSILIVSIGFIFLFRLYRYRTWMNSGYYKLAGWTEFFEKRSGLFWKKRMYTPIRITFILKEGADELCKKAIQTFTSTQIQKWKYRYQGIDWEAGWGQPKDMISDGASISGEISRVELRWVISVLSSAFVPVARMLGNDLLEVVIKSDAAEVERKTKKVSRSVYDRQSGSSA